MSNQYTTINELNEQHLQHRAGFELKDLIATNDHGEVNIVEFNVMAQPPLSNGNSVQICSLKIQGNPLDVRMKLINDVSVSQDIVRETVCIVLEDAMNWVRGWEPAEHQDKSAIFNKVNTMLEKSERLIQIGRHHFSGLTMQRMIVDLATSVKYQDGSKFREFISDFEKTSEMKIDLKMAEAIAPKAGFVNE